eukprot:15081277-Heterocapsa_arctica.AAC.1
MEESSRPDNNGNTVRKPMGTLDTLELRLKKLQRPTAENKRLNKLQRTTAENRRLGFAGYALYGLNTSSMNPQMPFNPR